LEYFICALVFNTTIISSELHDLQTECLWKVTVFGGSYVIVLFPLSQIQISPQTLIPSSLCFPFRKLILRCLCNLILSLPGPEVPTLSYLPTLSCPEI